MSELVAAGTAGGPPAGVIAPGEPAGSILIVDDTVDNLRLLSQTLTEHGYRVRAATSGPRALESVRAAPPDLILLDIRMPEMDGFAVCAALKASAQTRDIPVLFISALDELGDKVRAFHAGGVDYITKPFRVEEVLARTQTHLALRRLQQRLEAVNRRFELELQLAGRVQASFLPHTLPAIPGWELAACLRPARETSGDFFDVLRLPGGRVGLLIADVVDKGVPAALLMAMSWSLIETYTAEHPQLPAAAFAAVNQRLLQHLEGNQFLTAWYGVLDPESGRLIYCNAGHPPPLLLSACDCAVRRLSFTGPPLGMLEEGAWQTVAVTFDPGDTLVLYTDGVTDAQAADESPFDQARLLAAARAALGRPAEPLCDAVVAEVDAFVAGAPQGDDIALMVVRRAP